jgi:hypothetical protein
VLKAGMVGAQMPERGREGKHLQVDGKFPTCKANKEEKINLKNNQ